jgi:curved DNA-binding protein CbpA
MANFLHGYAHRSWDKSTSEEELEMLDEKILHSPSGWMEVAYRKILMLYHPDGHATDKDVWTAQFQILTTIKSTVTNTEERQKNNSQSRKAAQNSERDRGRAAEAPPNGEQGHVREREAAPPPPPRMSLIVLKVKAKHFSKMWTICSLLSTSLQTLCAH